MKETFENVIEWIGGNWGLALSGAAILLLVAMLIFPAVDIDKPEIYPQQYGPLISLAWDMIPGAAFYEVQGAALDADFETFTLSIAPTVVVPGVPGVARYRVRAWLDDGPGPWSDSTGYLFYLPSDAADGYEEEEEEAEPDEMASDLLWLDSDWIEALLVSRE